MAQVLIRNLREDVVKILKKMSREQGKSLQSEAKAYSLPELHFPETSIWLRRQ
jgi:plasmid stability protein